MKFAILFACMLAAVSAQQYNKNNPFSFYNRNQNRQNYNSGQYNSNGQYNRYNSFNPYTPFSTKAPYRPFASVTTPTPTIATTRVPATFAPATFAPSSFAPVTSAPVTVAPYSVSKPVVPYAKVYSDSRDAAIIKYGNEVNPDGAFNYFFETENGIAAQEQGVPRSFPGEPPVSPVVVQGSFSWTSPEGQPIGITYVADENGYQPSGDAIPSPPPVPAQIARALEYTARFFVPQGVKK